MATARQQQAMNQLQPILQSVAQVVPENLVQKERLGTELCFDYIQPLLNEITNAAKRLLKLELEKVPHGLISQLVSPFQQIQSLINQIGTFTVSNGTGTRNQIGQSLEDHWNSIYMLVNVILSSQDEHLARNEIELLSTQLKTSVQLSSDAAEALRAKQVEMTRNLDAFLEEKSATFAKEGEAKLKAVEDALDAVRKVAAEAGVSQTARHFKDEAREHLITARFWLAALTIMVSVLISFSLFSNVILNWAGTPEPASDAANILQIRYLAQKGLIVFCLVFALIWSAKNYGASRHNYVVNKHRNNALGSFQAFAASAVDEQTKSAVLIQATQSIFSPQTSGYVKTDGENSPQGPIIEILRSIGASKDK